MRSSVLCRLILRRQIKLSDFIYGCKKWLCREDGLQAEGNDDKRFQRGTIRESSATVLIQPSMTMGLSIYNQKSTDLRSSANQL